MSLKIKNLLHSVEFMHKPPLFRDAVLETAFQKGLIGVDIEKGFFIDPSASSGHQIYMGLLDLDP